jgi:hypothetical protein
MVVLQKNGSGAGIFTRARPAVSGYFDVAGMLCAFIDEIADA